MLTRGSAINFAVRKLLNLLYQVVLGDSNGHQL